MKKSLCANWFQRQGECQSLPTKNFYSKPERMVGNQAMLIHVLKHLFLPLSSTQPMVSDFFFFFFFLSLGFFFPLPPLFGTLFFTHHSFPSPGPHCPAPFGKLDLPFPGKVFQGLLLR